MHVEVGRVVSIRTCATPLSPLALESGVPGKIMMVLYELVRFWSRCCVADSDCVSGVAATVYITDTDCASAVAAAVYITYGNCASIIGAAARNHKISGGIA